MLIKDLRRKQHLTQKQLASKLDLPYQSIQKWEKGTGSPTPKHIPALAAALGVGVETVLSIFSSWIPGNTKSIQNQLYELVNELPLISVKQSLELQQRKPIQTTQLITGTYKVLVPAIQLTDKHVVIEIDGDLMAPEIKHGAFVLAEAINQEQFKSQSGGVFAVLYSNGFTVKRIKSNNLAEGFLQLHSDNEKFGTDTIPAADLVGMWKVLMKVQERVS